MWTLWNKNYLFKKQFLKILWSEVWKGGFQLMQILGLLGMYFDNMVVEVEKYLLFFRLALAILWYLLVLFKKLQFDNFENLILLVANKTTLHIMEMIYRLVIFRKFLFVYTFIK